MNWPELEELYAASLSDNERVRRTAQQAIDANFDTWFEEYKTLPANAWRWDAYGMRKGAPRFTKYDDLAGWTAGWLMRNESEPYPDYFKRQESLRRDRLGIMLRHRKHEIARKLHENDWEFVTLYGDRYMLGLEPAHGKQYGLPDAEEYREFVIPADAVSS